MSEHLHDRDIQTGLCLASCRACRIAELEADVVLMRDKVVLERLWRQKAERERDEARGHLRNVLAYVESRMDEEERMEEGHDAHLDLAREFLGLAPGAALGEQEASDE